MTLIENLSSFIPESRLKSRLIDRVSFASDGGFYQMTPQVIVMPIDEIEIKKIFSIASKFNIPVVFRAGGTSLSGQSITDGILIDLSRFWRRAFVENNGANLRIEPGVIGGNANAYLKKYNRKIGPDPSSINSAMMGGILSNNASGMCCGVKHNSYHTLKYISFVLPNGNSFNTEKEEDFLRFEKEEVLLFNTIKDIKAQINDNNELTQKIRYKYLIKNTVGYSINSFLDYDHPLDIFAHLLIGGEGTLAFISQAVIETLPDYQYKATTILYFNTIEDACKAILPLKDSNAEALELMDRASLRSVENIKGVPDLFKSAPESAAALLCEYQSDDINKLEDLLQNAENVISNLQLLEKPYFTRDEYQQQFFWKLRKGMFPSVGAVREKGTTVILEDIAFPIEHIASAVLDIQSLFIKYHYHNAIIFGHAKDGNIHFVVTQSFDLQSEIERYDHFIREVVDLVVVKYNGSLKAEHGTGRNMAPFVEVEWGTDAFEMMKKLKNIVDPQNILNPGVIINMDKESHIKNLKSLPVVEEEVDKCIECGFCEQKCPSKDLTLTPRRRIVVRRELARMKASNNTKDYQLLLDQYQYDGLDTCAVDGLCATDCPVDINTGDLVKRLRRENHSDSANSNSLKVARNFKTIEKGLKLGISLAKNTENIIGSSILISASRAFKKLVPDFPLYSNQLSKPVTILPQITENDEYVYFPTCITRMMGGNNNGKDNIATVIKRVSIKAGVILRIPENTSGQCCGQAFSSKGFKDAYINKATEFVNQAYDWTEKGKLPIVMDVSSCTYTTLMSAKDLDEPTLQKFKKIKFLDTVDFAKQVILPKLNPTNQKQNIVLHPVCSLTKLGNQKDFVEVAKKYAINVTVPTHVGCCGMAGDRGFLVPELTESATKVEANEIKQHQYEGYYSSAKTCEMAMGDACGSDFESILYLIDESTN